MTPYKVTRVFVIDGEYRVRINVQGETYQHPNRFTDKTDASVFAGKVAKAHQVDITKWETIT